MRKQTPEHITSLLPHQILVFGSNGEGRHGKGLAKQAMQFGAIYGQAQGRQGQTYAIITKKNFRIPKSSTLKEIEKELYRFLWYAIEHPELEFLVTKLGSSLAGYTVEEIKELFRRLYILFYIPDNVILPKEYEVRT